MSAVAAVSLLADGLDPVEVVGTGPLADEVRVLLGERARPSHPGVRRPAAIIETTGDGAAVEAALQRVEDLGTVVLAGPLLSRTLALDLYENLHVRGLTLIGVSPDEP